MSEYKDLSKYIYLYEYQKAYTYNVGWLGKRNRFNLIKLILYRPFLTKKFYSKLNTICEENIIFKLRGLHRCELCRKHHETGEIRVFDKKKTYASPSMIYHYVKDHLYIPPLKFILAVKKIDLESYKKEIQEYEQRLVEKKLKQLELLNKKR